MTGRLRRAGHGRGTDGDWTVWSVAEGRRGRRWREVGHDGAHVISSLLLEIEPDGRFAHLEASTAAGLVTLHPEPDRTLHGNVVTADGVEPVEGLPWDDDGVVLVEGSVVTGAAAIQRLAASMPPSATRHVLALSIRLPLQVGTTEPIRIARIDERRWQIGDGEPFEVDADGTPVLHGGEQWPLEAPS